MKALRILALIGLLFSTINTSNAVDMGGVNSGNTATASINGKIVFDRNVNGSKFIVAKSGKATSVHYVLAGGTELVDIRPINDGTAVSLVKDNCRTIVFFPVRYPENKDESVEWVKKSENEFNALLVNVKL